MRPLLKMNPPTSPSDTRPIANPCELAKIFERVVHGQITDFSVTNDVLGSRQSGYRCGFNTQSALLRMCHDIRRAVDLGQVKILVLFDFSKAFDTVCHSRLLIKLRALGFSDSVLFLVFSYLTGRTQSVVDERVNARAGLLLLRECLRVLFWILSTLFLNDICSSLKFSQHMILADDTQIYQLNCPRSWVYCSLRF